jgi:hypothetical protein
VFVYISTNIFIHTYVQIWNKNLPVIVASESVSSGPRTDLPDDNDDDDDDDDDG